MINHNGIIQQFSSVALENNRGFLYGDALFETIKVANNTILFLEEHYFRLMSSMRICRMEIPMNFTLEYFEEQIFNLLQSMRLNTAARVRFTVYRNDGGYYLPKDINTGFIVQATPLFQAAYMVPSNLYEVDLYKDFYVSKHLLSTLKTTNKMINITGSIFAKENDLQNCLLLNEDKNIVEALNGSIFMKSNSTIYTPPLSDGCLNGIMRKQLINIINKIDGFECIEKSISPFDLQKSDELFISNVIMGIQPITKYRKKEYEINFSNTLNKQLNDFLNLKVS